MKAEKEYAQDHADDPKCRCPDRFHSTGDAARAYLELLEHAERISKLVRHIPLTYLNRMVRPTGITIEELRESTGYIKGRSE